ncbi:MAG TPA: class I SAM-dependent methyltransferase [Negativicutes bacterium]|nr:class I SAM-dependent methyltransferase [Negativicutes bacterium]
MIVTTSLSSLPDDVAAAYRFASEIDGTYARREHDSLSEIQTKYNVTQFVVIENKQPIVYQGEDRFFFHRGMAELRILNFIRSGNDPMIAAMGLETGMSVLDCTLGLAADSLVAAFAVGDTGVVQGLEAACVVEALTRWGLTELCAAQTDARMETKQAARRIQVIHADHANYLAMLPDQSVDVVYFDPMFRRPQKASVGIAPLRNFADARPLTVETLQHAKRVARCRVVIKEAHGSPEFVRLGIRNFGGGRYSPVQYGILFKEEKS